MSGSQQRKSARKVIIYTLAATVLFWYFLRKPRQNIKETKPDKIKRQEKQLLERRKNQITDNQDHQDVYSMLAPG